MTEPPPVVYVTPQELATALHLPTTANERLERVCVRVSDSIDYFTGHAERMDPVPATVSEVALAWAVELYKQPDAAFGIVGMGETGPVRMPRDSYKRFIQDLAPYTLSWGFA